MGEMNVRNLLINIFEENKEKKFLLRFNWFRKWFLNLMVDENLKLIKNVCEFLVLILRWEMLFGFSF